MGGFCNATHIFTTNSIGVVADDKKVKVRSTSYLRILNNWVLIKSVPKTGRGLYAGCNPQFFSFFFFYIIICEQIIQRIKVKLFSSFLLTIMQRVHYCRVMISTHSIGGLF